MGEPSVFGLFFQKFIGLGIFFNIHHVGKKRVLNISFALPFIGFEIYFRKSKENKWF